MLIKQIEQHSYDFFYSLNNKENLNLYFKFKNKYEYSFILNEYQTFSQNILTQLNSNSHWVNADTLVIPQTSNNHFIKLLESTNKKIIILKKTSKEKIKIHLEKQQMMKAEKAKLFHSIDEMDTMQIAHIAGNQRKRFTEFLFDPLSTEELEYLHNHSHNIVFIDDSIFSGFTFLAAQHCLLNIPHHNIILFDKQN